VLRSAEAEPASPCTNVCALDPATGWCLGCGRTIEEIAGWGMATAEERRAILAALPGRMARLG
jgi:predicted Fe-S protein YdhL (DUF1289 family)